MSIPQGLFVVSVILIFLHSFANTNHALHLTDEPSSKDERDKLHSKYIYDKEKIEKKYL